MTSTALMSVWRIRALTKTLSLKSSLVSFISLFYFIFISIIFYFYFLFAALQKKDLLFLASMIGDSESTTFARESAKLFNLFAFSNEVRFLLYFILFLFYFIYLYFILFYFYSVLRRLRLPLWTRANRASMLPRRVSKASRGTFPLSWRLRQSRRLWIGE